MSLVPLLSAAALASSPPQVHGLATWPSNSVQLAVRPVGRVEQQAGGAGWRYQWPGTYFEARFSGPVLYVDLGTGPTHVRVSVDDVEVADVIGPDQRVLRIDGLAQGEHRARVDFVSESQAGANLFGGMAVPAGSQRPAPEPRPRAIEFIGDSYTVGYGSASASRTCTVEEVWRTTDNSLAFGPQVARHFGADYRVMAISGRGMVRNFANSPGQTLPQAYAHLLPGMPGPAPESVDEGWSPQLIVIGLGTNDFSVPVAPGEPWRNAAALSEAFEARYVQFVQSLKRRHPAARFVLVATDAGQGAAERAIGRVQSRLRMEGTSLEMLVLGQLELDACDWHPSRADQQSIARRMIPVIETMALRW
jgi:lysophospholipase L1-like esterase